MYYILIYYLHLLSVTVIMIYETLKMVRDHSPYRIFHYSKPCATIAFVVLDFVVILCR